MIYKYRGGESFVYSEIVNLIDWLRGKKNIGTITFATNGMFIPSENVLMALQKDKRISVRISDYRLSGTPENFRKILEERGIKNWYYQFCNGIGEWRDLGGIDLPPVGDAKMKEHFDTCSFKGCLTLENGELTYCSRASNSFKLQKFVRHCSDYLVVNDDLEFEKKLKDFVQGGHPMEACRYCNGSAEGKPIAPAIQVTNV